MYARGAVIVLVAVLASVLWRAREPFVQEGDDNDDTEAWLMQRQIDDVTGLAGVKAAHDELDTKILRAIGDKKVDKIEGHSVGDENTGTADYWCLYILRDRV
jgi:hypothetical protein